MKRLQELQLKLKPNEPKAEPNRTEPNGAKTKTKSRTALPFFLSSAIKSPQQNEGKSPKGRGKKRKKTTKVRFHFVSRLVSLSVCQFVNLPSQTVDIQLNRQCNRLCSLTKKAG